MQGKLLTLICALALAKGVQSNVDPFSTCARACNTCLCLPSEPPTICSAIDAEGILLPHDHCNKFYICNHGSKVTFDCFGDLLFNPLTGQCDYVHNVVCGDRIIPGKEDENEVSDGGDSKEEDNNDGSDVCNCNPGEAVSICSAANSNGILVAHDICNKFFLCNHGIPTPMNCPRGLVYNPYTEKCDWHHKVECGDRIIIEEVEVDNENEDKEEVDVENGNGENDCNVESGNCHCNPDEAPLICSVQGSEGTLVAHEVCNNYFICNHGIPVTMNCPKGLLYNPYIERCDWPDNVECGDRIVVEESEDNSDNSDNSNENNGGNSTCNCDPGEAPLICAGSGSDGTLVAHEVCNKYFICNHGVPNTMKCPKGLLYNPYIERCDWRYNVECGNRVIIEEEDGNENSENGSHSNENGGDNDNNTGPCNCNPAEAPSICSNEGSEGILVAHEICCKFYICNHGVPVTKRCPFGLLYNPYTEKCDWARNVECGDRVIAEEGENEKDSNENENNNSSNESESNSSSNESENDNSSNESEENVSENENQGVGNATCNCNPAEASSICSAANSDGILVAHEVCCWFYKCYHGIPTKQVCPSGLLYNPYTEQCDWPHNVDCSDRVLIEEKPQPETDLFEIAKVKCTDAESDGHMAVHQNCHQFYVCLKNEPALLSCPLGLYFDAVKQTCDWPQNVHCGSRMLI